MQRYRARTVRRTRFTRTGGSKYTDLNGVRRLTVHGNDDIHFASAGEVSAEMQIDLIDADELGLRPCEQNFNGLASDRRGDLLRTTEPNTGSKQDEKDLIAF